MQHEIRSLFVKSASWLNLGFFLLCLSACGGDAAVSDMRAYRSTHEGLHLERVGKRSLLGTFRRDGQQIHFEALYRPYRAVLPDTSSWAVRFFDEGGEDFIVEDNGNAPPQWAKKANLPQVSAKPLSASSLDRRNALMSGLILLAKDEAAVDVPAGCEAAWERVLHSLRVAERFFDPDTEQARPEARPQVARSKPTAPLAPQTADVQGLSGTHRIGRLAPRELTVDANYEFRQEMELWSQRVRNLLEVGYRTRKHHSATVTNVFYRARGSEEPWRPFRRFIAANHGAFPGEDAMEKYADCKNFPTTQGYFAWKGECEGSWFWYHLCNDDTAYQIWHAYGNWSETNRCLGKRRDHRPWCDEPWAPEKPSVENLSEQLSAPVVELFDATAPAGPGAPDAVDHEALREVGEASTKPSSAAPLPLFVRDVVDSSSES